MKVFHALIVLSLFVLAACGESKAPPSSTVSPSPSSSPEDLGQPLPDPLPEVLARVNGQAIRMAEVMPLTLDELRRFPPGQRDAKTPLVLRHALKDYIDQELLLQEALRRGIEVDARTLEREYDQARREHPNDDDWAKFLHQLGLDPQSLRAALRVRHTVAALVRQEAAVGPVSEEEARAAYDANPLAFTRPGARRPPPFEAVRGKAEEAVRQRKETEAEKALVARLRAKARIETFI